MNQDERASQLSAMFDGELPAAECELLSRRLARDEQLRATWSRYSVIGAALRAEPMAQVRPDFSRRVSAALAGGGIAGAGVRRTRLLRGAALGTAVAAGVAGVAILLLRNGLPLQEEALTAFVPSAARVALPVVGSQSLLAGGQNLPSVNFRRVDASAVNAGNALASYVVPPQSDDNSQALSASLADYVVAHSEVSSPLARGGLLSALVGDEMVQPAPSEMAPEITPVMTPVMTNGQR